MCAIQGRASAAARLKHSTLAEPTLRLRRTSLILPCDTGDACRAAGSVRNESFGALVARILANDALKLSRGTFLTQSLRRSCSPQRAHASFRTRVAVAFIGKVRASGNPFSSGAMVARRVLNLVRSSTTWRARSLVFARDCPVLARNQYGFRVGVRSRTPVPSGTNAALRACTGALLGPPSGVAR